MKKLAGIGPGTEEHAPESPGADGADTRTASVKLLSVLLQYPTAELAAHSDEVAFLVEAMDSGAREPLAEFLEQWRRRDLLWLQQEYVRSFDFRKRVSLNLTYYQYGGKRQRGLALVRLKHAYAAAGLPLRDGEIPDSLPVLLEFAALAPDGWGLRLLVEFRAAIEMVALAVDGDSPYAGVMRAVRALLPALTPDDRAAMQSLAAGGPPTELVGLEPHAPPEAVREPAQGCAR